MFYQSENISNNLAYTLNQKDQTACITYSRYAEGDVFIPKEVEFNSIKYLVIGIKYNAFQTNSKIISIHFADDSEIQFIENNAFANCSIKKLYIPASLKNLDEGFCNNVYNLTEIEISPKNQFFSIFNDQFLIKKEEEKGENLIFCCRNAETAVIPSKVTRIGKLSFSDCSRLKSISFSEKSQLKSIGKNAFLRSAIKEFFIPENVIEIEEGWCEGTIKLTKLEISSNNKHFIYYENKLLITNNKILFARRNIQNISIPNNIKRICDSSFEHCHNLSNLSFGIETSIESIGKRCFLSCWNLKDFSQIPIELNKIEDSAFYSCKKLKSLNFAKKSKIKKFCSNTFAWCFDLVSIINIPETLNEIDRSCFIACISLKFIEFLSSEMTLKNNCFKDCSHLTIVSFPNAHCLYLEPNIFSKCSKDFVLFVNSNSQIIIQWNF